LARLKTLLEASPSSPISLPGAKLFPHPLASKSVFSYRIRQVHEAAWGYFDYMLCPHFVERDRLSKLINGEYSGGEIVTPPALVSAIELVISEPIFVDGGISGFSRPGRKDFGDMRDG